MSRSLLLVLVVLLLGSNAYAWYQLHGRRAALEKREAELQETRRALETQVGNLEVQADTMRAEIEVLNRRLADTRLAVGKLRTKSGLEQRFRQSYPQLAQSDWGVVDVYDEMSKRYVEYMVVPLWMSETFIIDHENAALSGRCIGRG
jgi:uncharacterized protein HemX